MGHVDRLRYDVRRAIAAAPADHRARYPPDARWLSLKPGDAGQVGHALYARRHVRLLGARFGAGALTFEDGLRQLRILETVLESSKKRAWADVKG